MASAPIYVGTPKTWHAALATANTNRDGTGAGIVTVASGGGSGSRIDRVRAVSRGTTTAGVVRLFLSDGVNVRLLKEILVDAVTPSTTVKVWEAEVAFADGLVLPSGWSLQASTHIANDFNVQAQGGDF